jgi:hypothetical protein
LFFVTFVLFVVFSIVPQAGMNWQAVSMVLKERKDAKASSFVLKFVDSFFGDSRFSGFCW